MPQINDPIIIPIKTSVVKSLGGEVDEKSVVQIYSSLLLISSNKISLSILRS